MIRVPVEGIRVSGRNTQGVRIMNLTAGDLVVDVARVVKEDEGDDGDGDEEEGAAPAGRPAKGGSKRGKPGAR
jgi:DNA gyrase subunit A